MSWFRKLQGLIKLKGGAVDDSQRKRKAGLLKVDFTQEKIVHILEPIKYEVIGPNPRIKYYASAQVPDGTRFSLCVYDDGKGPLKKKLKSYDVPDIQSSGLSEFLLPNPLPDGRYCLQLVGKTPNRTKIVSAFREVLVDPTRAFQNRTHCPAAWTFLFLGPIRANPCCNLKAGAGFPFNPEVSTIDPLNSPGMLALRESLLKGFSPFCHGSCHELKRSQKYNSAEDAFIKYAKTNTTEVHQESAFLRDKEAFRQYVRGELFISHPQTLKIALGSKCNHACIFCKAIQRDWQQNESVFSDIVVKYAGDITRLMLTGGEPLVYWKHFYNKLRQHRIDLSNVIFSIITNGALLPQFAEQLADFKELQLFVSMNAATPESYQRVHRRDDFEKVKAGILAVQKSRLGKPTKIHLKMVYMRSNYKDMLIYPHLAKELNADGIAFCNMTYFRQGDAAPREALKIDDPEWPEVEKFISEAEIQSKNFGIPLEVRRPGDKRTDPLDEADSYS